MAESTNQSAAEKSVRPKSSKAWEHFTLNAAKKIVTCKLCKAELVWHGSTTVMHEHMKRKHVGVTDEGETARKKQLTMSEFVQRRNPPCTPQQAAIVTDAILSMLVTDMRPMAMVEDEGFKKMVSILNPGYILPSRTHFTKLMERKYQEAFQKIKSAINTTNSRMALTTDIWTSVATEAYLGITCHYIGNDWKMTSVCLTTMPLEDRHTSTNIAEWLEEVAVKFEIPFENICAIVHDNGANVVAAAKLLEEKHGWTSIRCTGHTLQLVINAALKNTVIQRAVGAARCLVEHFKKKGKRYLDLKPDQWSLLEELSTALKPFECATVFMSGPEYITVSSLPPLVKGLLKSTEGAAYDTASVKSFQVTAVEQLQNRWKETLFDQVDNPVILSSALDPRFRKLKFLSPEQIITVQAKLQTEALAARREMVQQQQITTSTIRTAAEPSTSLIDSLLESGDSSEEESREEKAEEDHYTQIRN
ncbi:E3 SUMO-protein ligase ZBED1-like [Xyrauchen texanus]|uniref:E3 SUMO-protein ligase ZBED1-like n=1 Tax=Xyrauchen texanus TaxID=154827 RepID=UPI002241A13D|nr:E3 SUMO-protein ligase ZBED1-like [Xyrauchen texanus]